MFAISLIASLFALYLPEEIPLAKAYTCYADTPAYVNTDTTVGVDRAGCWGYDSAHPYLTLQAAVNDRNGRYTGGSVQGKIYYKDKRAGATEILRNPTGIPFTIVPYVSNDSIGTRVLLSGQNLTIKNYMFTAGGVNLNNSTSNNISIESNSFQGGASVNIRGASYYGLVYSNNNINVRNNKFNNAEVNVDGNNGMTNIYSNSFGGTVPADGNWIYIKNTSGNPNITGNTVSGGMTLSTSNSSGLIVMSNIHDGNGSSLGYRFSNTGIVSFSNNNIKDSYTGVYMVGTSSPTIKSIESNTINLSDLYPATTTGLKTDGVIVENVHKNSFYNSTNGAVFANSTVGNTYSNNFYEHSTAALTYSGGSASKIYQNIIDKADKGIYVTSLGTASEIYGNTISNGTTGIIVERSTGGYDNSLIGENEGYSPLTGESGTIRIYTNILSNFTDSGIGLHNVWAAEVNTNFAGSVGSLLKAYYSAIDNLNANFANSGLQGSIGIKLYDTDVTTFSRNNLTAFQTGLEATNGSQAITGVNGLWVDGGDRGIYLENSDLNDIVNSIFTNNEYGIYGGVSSYGYVVKNSSFYKQTKSPIYQVGALTGVATMSVQNNAFSRAGDTFVYVSSSGDLSTLNYNVYDNSNGVSVLELGSTSYIFDDLWSLGRETNGVYQNSGDLFPGANSNVFQLNPSSLAMNSADSTLGVTTDIFGTARDMCNVPDMGAVESSDDSDLDSDGLCHDQEFAFATDENISDTDVDLLSDYREIYVHGTDPLDDDTDNDGVKDGTETGSYYIDPLDSDTDNDGLTDGEEVNTYGSDADNVDTDGDTFNDYDEVMAGTDPTDALSNPDTVDDDGDGIPNVSEPTYGTDPLDADSDDDGLNDYEEIVLGTDPLDSDTDDDLLADGEEGTYGTDPDNYDTDGDTYGDYEEILNLTDPLDASSIPDLTDDDADGLSNTVEGVLGTDPNDSDTDGDALSDYEEFYTYSTDPTLSDTDSDGLNDYAEVITYGTDAEDADMDDDGLDDGDEISLGTDVEVSDSDSDGLTDGEEVNTYGSNPLLVDTDSDGLDDADEVAAGSDLNDSDTDDDGLSDAEEVTNGTDPSDSDSDDDGLSDIEELNVYSTDPNNSDSDGDTYSDSVEVAAGTDPLDAVSTPGGLDTDGDGLTLDEETAYGTDAADADTDDDGLNDYQEAITYFTNPLLEDTDSDGLNDYAEIITYGTDAMNADTDSDLYNDADEISMGTDPLDSSSTPGGLDIDGDGLTYDEETAYGSDPSLADTDSDGLNDYQELITYSTSAVSSDTDLDGLSDYAEVITYGTDANLEDTDSDTYSDYAEVTAGSDALDASSTPGTLDSDGDGLTYDEETSYGTDAADADTDGDGLSDGDEVDTYGSDPLAVDSDSDGLDDADEVTYGTDPWSTDSDLDGYDDATEVAAGSNPNDAASDPTTSLTDTDSDGLTDYEESVYGSDASDTDSDDDTLEDGDEVDIYSTDPVSNDTDGDGFRDDYEISELTDPDDATSMPSLTIYALALEELTGLTSSSATFTSYITDTLNPGSVNEYEFLTTGYGAMAIRYNTDQYVGELTVKYCGASSSAWSASYTYSSCRDVISYTEAFATVGENSIGTSVSTSDQLEVWARLSPYYTFSEWNWFRSPYTTSTTRYQLFTIEL